LHVLISENFDNWSQLIENSTGTIKGRNLLGITKFAFTVTPFLKRINIIIDLNHIILTYFMNNWKFNKNTAVLFWQPNTKQLEIT